MGQSILDRAKGCFLGQLAGDALGSLVEFQSKAQIKETYPSGVRDMHDGGTWNTLAGQPTDDSEMAIALARSITEADGYNEKNALRAYREWMNSEPFDIGATVSSGLRGVQNIASEANGALMRVSPIGILGSNFTLEQVGRWAELDAMITHPSVVCRQANILFAKALAYAITNNPTPSEIYRAVLAWSQDINAETKLVNAIQKAQSYPPENFERNQGWILIAFQNAFYQLLNCGSLEHGVVDTISYGGDTDTNGAIVGALLGAVYGTSVIPLRWRESLMNCKPDRNRIDVYRPRPEKYWPIYADNIVDSLLNITPRR
ncbi:ADP-ribosylglycohydrolase family protein [Agrobacterium larrymoorei]|uniref:ADP-ribosylglycohydrolase family protein n=1 Tax=Agrobacterium larrymoorei TaxID=160699 RepID=UPI0015724E63|nr:ADP-ribosylglycohydrolase family protein [Agrobacterium larrymoorei]NTJ44993.1 ADP-ribosylglycohydrolase family protein [Agrobacterium larrymoorei]